MLALADNAALARMVIAATRDPPTSAFVFSCPSLLLGSTPAAEGVKACICTGWELTNARWRALRFGRLPIAFKGFSTPYLRRN
jgi:hypothetical protein